jgi:hypothetical protein
LSPCCRKSSRASRASALLAALLLGAAPLVLADAQRDPELRGIVARAIEEKECFPDKFDAEVW